MHMHIGMHIIVPFAVADVRIMLLINLLSFLSDYVVSISHIFVFVNTTY